MRRGARARAGRRRRRVKIGRKGTGGFEVVVHGRAAHAGLEPEKGVNALVEAAHQVLAIAALGPPRASARPSRRRWRRPARPTTSCRPRRACASTCGSPSSPRPSGWRRRWRRCAPVDPAARLEVLGGLNRPPMPESATAELFDARPSGRGGRSGSTSRSASSVGGGSDGNFTAALGIPTLDGLGVTGGGAHADHEWADTDHDARPHPPARRPGRRDP